MISLIKERCIAGGRLLPALAIGGVGGGLAYAVHTPLPWLLGALIATTVLSLAGVRLQAPTNSRKSVLVVIGVMLGGAFTPDLAANLALWGISLAIMFMATAVMIVVSVWLSRRVAGNSVETAIYSGVPGGISSVTLMAADSSADLRIVGLTHGVRILVVLLVIPPLMQWSEHVSLQQPSMTLTQWLAFPGFDEALMLVIAGVAGAWLGQCLRLPNPLLFGPVLLSGALHVSGLSEATIPPAVIALAQIVIGVSVGARFVGGSLASVGSSIVIALVQALVLLIIAIVAAWIAHVTTGFSLAAALLAYMPGGAPELSLVALSLGIEPAFVTSHHLARITILILLMPALVAFLKRVGD
ncbi:AbrB family transcriptional regulator [Marinobacter sediminum]|uniref:AbrB family transcriptional regulator n=1 Tax=Marinobacter sediminum TaxID=256323 RepID=UPI00193AAAAF|nr:AbrB family transcriptional regulator [Marinobacter sediminum]